MAIIKTMASGVLGTRVVSESNPLVIIEQANINMNGHDNGISVDLTLRLEEAPKNMEELHTILANVYLKNKGINMTMDEVVSKFLPEYVV